MRIALLIVTTAMIGTCSSPPTLLEEVRTLGELRVITRNNPTTYYIGAHGAQGPEYDLMHGFANFLGVELKLSTVEPFSAILPAVRAGTAHIAAAGLTVTPERARLVKFGSPYQPVSQHLIYKLGTGRPRKFEDIVGKRLEVVAGTSYVETLKRMQQQVPRLAWIENPHADVAELLMKVADQSIDYTIVDSTIFAIYQNYLPEIRIAFDVAVDDVLAWAFPPRNDDSLIESADQYLRLIRDTGEFDRIMDRYYGHTEQFDYVSTRQFIRDFSRKLPRYKAMFEKAAEQIGMDWRMLAAIGYQESHWDPLAVSPTGVRGIMMLTEETARFVGVEDRIDPEQSIAGGASYLARIKRRIPESITEPDRTWFALAAYNVGYGHLQDAREITVINGGNPRHWIDVKRSLLLLTQRKWYSRVKSGYARGWEPVQYVENIRSYFNILLWLTSSSPEAVPDGAGEPDINLTTQTTFCCGKMPAAIPGTPARGCRHLLPCGDWRRNT